MRRWLRWLFFGACTDCGGRLYEVRWTWRWHRHVDKLRATVVLHDGAPPVRWCQDCQSFRTDVGTTPFGTDELVARGLMAEANLPRRVTPRGWRGVEAMEASDEVE
jgi:hypothetical protein